MTAKPARSASKAKWVEYVSATYGVDFAVTDDCTRTELIDACDAAEADAQTQREATALEQQRRESGVGRGDVEAATLLQLQQDHLDGSALAASAVTLARHVDQADTATAAAAAARELRMTLATARSVLVNKPSPAEDDEDGVVVGPNRLLQLRERAGGSSGR